MGLHLNWGLGFGSGVCRTMVLLAISAGLLAIICVYLKSLGLEIAGNNSCA